MHRQHHIGRQRLQLRDRVLDIVGRRDAEVKPADHGVQLVDVRDRHRGPDRVDDAAMAARRDDDEPAALHDIAGRVLVGVAVGDEPAAPLRRRCNDRAGVGSTSVFGSHLLEGVAARSGPR